MRHQGHKEVFITSRYIIDSLYPTWNFGICRFGKSIIFQDFYGFTELQGCVCNHLTRTGWWHSADWFNTMTGAASGCQIWFKVTCMQRQKNQRSMDRRAKVSFQSTKSCMFLFVTFRRHAHSVWSLSFFRVLLKRLQSGKLLCGITSSCKICIGLSDLHE